MAIVKGLKIGFVNSTQKVGEWSIPQQPGDDKPRGNKNYDAWDMRKGFDYGTTKRYNGLNIKNVSGTLYLTKGKASVRGFLFDVESDIELLSGAQIILGINNNPTDRNTYIDIVDTPRALVQEELSRDSGIYEVEIWLKKGSDWVYTFPQSKTIRDYLQATLLENQAGNYYQAILWDIGSLAVTEPEDYKLENKSITMYVDRLGNTSNQDYLRIIRGETQIDIPFDEDSVSIGKNIIYLYFDSESKVVATTGKKKEAEEGE